MIQFIKLIKIESMKPRLLLANYLKFISVFVIFFNYILLESFFSIIYWLFFVSVYSILTYFLSRANPYSSFREIFNIYLSTLFLFTIVGQLMTLGYKYSSGSYFSYWNDDQYYLSIIEKNLSNIDYEHPKFGTILINSILDKLANLFNLGEPFVNMLSSNWALAPVIVVISYNIACNINKTNIPKKNIILGIFTQNVVYFALLHFYRDIYAILFFSISLLLLSRKKYWLSVLFVIISASFRKANASVLLLFIVFHFLINSKIIVNYFIRSWYKFVVFLFLISLIFTSSKVQTFVIENALSSVMKAAKYKDVTDLASFTEQRKNSLFSNEGMYKGGAMFEGNLFKSIALPVIFPFIVPGNYYIDYEFKSTVKKYFSFYGVLMAICVFFLPLFLSSFCLSIIDSFRSKEYEVRFIIIMLFTFLLLSSFISIVPRHYVYFIILFPTILSVPNTFNLNNRKLYLFFLTLFFFLIFSYRTIIKLI